MARLGPFGPAPRLAVAVSGGADSTALALLSKEWTVSQGGSLIALIVDHGLRAGSDIEAVLTQSRLAARGIAAQILKLSGLPTGAKLQETARQARYVALMNAARAENALFLALGHHAADQSETVIMREMRGPSGLEGIAAWAARTDCLLLRPLLGFDPEELRTFLLRQQMPWAEDPSNTSLKFERIRVRQSSTRRVAADSMSRQNREREIAVFVADHTTLRPEGFAVIHANAAPVAALSALLRVIGGANYAPRQDAVRRLATSLASATLGGVRIARTVKFGGGWLLVREPAACHPPVPISKGAMWDGRFRLGDSALSGSFGALGDDAAAWRKTLELPSLVLRGMPCLRHDSVVTLFPAPCTFIPPFPVTTHPFAA